MATTKGIEGQGEVGGGRWLEEQEEKKGETIGKQIQGIVRDRDWKK